MDFRLGERSDRFRDEVRAFLGEYVTSEVIERMHATGTMHDWGVHKALAAKGWMAAGWPAEYGGQARDPFEVAALIEELGNEDAPFHGLGNSMLVASTLLHVGSDVQKREVIPRILAGDVVVCLGYSEPNSGSDVAAAATRAVRDGDEWIVNGQKIFTTLAEISEYVLLLTRTNPDVPKHKGLTLFLVPLSTPGIEIRAIRTLGGERTNEVFYSDVRVDDRCRVGEIDGGWDVLKVALTLERGLFGPPTEATRLLDRVVDWACEARDDDGRPMIDEPLIRDRLASLAIENEVSKLLAYRAIWVNAGGALPGVEGTMAKLFSTESFKRASSVLLDVLGAGGAIPSGVESAPAQGAIEQAYRHSVVTTIAGGTSEIMRSIVAEQHLGLPRSR